MVLQYTGNVLNSHHQSRLLQIYQSATDVLQIKSPDNVEDHTHSPTQSAAFCRGDDDDDDDGDGDGDGEVMMMTKPPASETGLA